MNSWLYWKSEQILYYRGYWTLERIQVKHLKSKKRILWQQNLRNCLFKQKTIGSNELGEEENPAYHWIHLIWGPTVQHAPRWHTLYSFYNSAENRPINVSFLNKISQADQIQWPSFSKQEFKDTIAKCSSSSTPGLDHIFWRHLKSLITNDRCLLRIVQIANACINLEYWPFVTNFIRSYLHQIFDDSHGLKASLKPLRRPFDRCQSCLEAINNGRDIKQINW